MIDDRASTIDGRPVTGQIAVEGSDCRLCLPEIGQPEGKQGVLFALVRCVRNEFDQGRTSPGTLVAAITTAMALARQKYVVDDLRYEWGPNGAQVIQNFSLEPSASSWLGTAWRPAKWVYLVGVNERIDVFHTDGRPFDDLSIPSAFLHTVIEAEPPPLMSRPPN